MSPCGVCEVHRVSVKSYHREEIVWNLLKMLACLHHLWRFLGKWYKYSNILCQYLEVIYLKNRVLNRNSGTSALKTAHFPNFLGYSKKHPQGECRWMPQKRLCVLHPQSPPQNFSVPTLKSNEQFPKLGFSSWTSSLSHQREPSLHERAGRGRGRENQWNPYS